MSNQNATYTRGSRPQVRLRSSRRHVLADKNEDTRIAVCSICGPVKIISKGMQNGHRRWMCSGTSYYQEDNRRSWNGNKARKKRRQAHRADLVEKYGESCNICGDVESMKSLAEDHCHTSGKTRGLLCTRCNLGLGFFADNIELLEEAIKYLKDRS